MRYFEKSAAAVLWAPYSLSRDINMNLSKKKKPLIEKEAGFSNTSIVAAAKNRLAAINNLYWAPKHVQELAKAKSVRQLDNIMSQNLPHSVNDKMPISRLVKITNENGAKESLVKELGTIAGTIHNKRFNTY